MEKSRNRVRLSHIFRNILAIVESLRNGTCLPNPAEYSDYASWARHKCSFFFDARSVQRRLSRMEKTRLLRELDAKLQETVRKFNNMSEEINMTREERYAECIFEWVKTDRSGDVCKFKEFQIENDIEYVVFADNSRVNISLIGDIVLMHDKGYEPIMGNSAFQGVNQNTVQPVTSVTQQPIHIENSPVILLLDKAKKTSQEILLPIEIMLPSVDMYNIVVENFENGDEEMVKFLRKEITEEKIISALLNALKDKYTKK